VPAEFQSPLSYPTTPSLVTAGTALGTHAGQIGLKKPGVIVLNANFIQPVAASFLAALKAQGITPVDVEQVDATKADYTDIALKFQASGAQSVAAFSTRSPTPACSRRWSARTGIRPSSEGGWTRRRRMPSTTAGCGATCAVFGADSVTPVLEYLDHGNVPAIAQYLNAVHTYFPGQFGALDAYTTYQWLAAEVFVQAIENIGNAPVTRQSLVDALNGIKNYDDGGHHPTDLYGPGNHDPLHCFQWIHNTNGRVENRIRLELLG